MGVTTNMAKSLTEILRRTAPGTLTESLLDEVRNGLQDSWDNIEGSNQEAMRPHKLQRIEQMDWHPPMLSFTIERHGGTVLGSTRAELQRWTIDTEEGAVVSVDQIGFRQIRARSADWTQEDAERQAEQIVESILARREEPYLTWTKAGDVRLSLTKAVPPGPKQTTQGRTARLRKAISAIVHRLESAGWVQDGNYWRATR